MKTCASSSSNHIIGRRCPVLLSGRCYPCPKIRSRVRPDLGVTKTVGVLSNVKVGCEGFISTGGFPCWCLLSLWSSLRRRIRLPCGRPDTLIRSYPFPASLLGGNLILLAVSECIFCQSRVKCLLSILVPQLRKVRAFAWTWGTLECT